MGTEPVVARGLLGGDALPVEAVVAASPAAVTGHPAQCRIRHTRPVLTHLTLVAVLTTWGERGQRWRWRERRLLTTLLPLVLAFRMGVTVGRSLRVRLVL